MTVWDCAWSSDWSIIYTKKWCNLKSVLLFTWFLSKCFLFFSGQFYAANGRQCFRHPSMFEEFYLDAWYLNFDVWVWDPGFPVLCYAGLSLNYRLIKWSDGFVFISACFCFWNELLIWLNPFSFSLLLLVLLLLLRLFFHVALEAMTIALCCTYLLWFAPENLVEFDVKHITFSWTTINITFHSFHNI